MKRVAALLFALCAVGVARADIGPPAGKKAVPVTTIVEATETFPDYAFFELSFSSTPGPPPHGGSSRSVDLHFFMPGHSIKGTGDWRSGGTLYAVPRAVAEGVPGWNGFATDAAKHRAYSRISTSDEKWFALGRSVQKGEIPGATSIRFGGNEQLPLNDERVTITENYRIVRTPAGVAFVKPDESAPAPDGRVEGDPALAKPAFPWPLVLAGSAGAATLLLGGLWLVRRNRKS